MLGCWKYVGVVIKGPLRRKEKIF